jgi:spermidine/putrescine transport system ATP-binding protein
VATIELIDVSKSFGTSLAVDSANILIPNGTFFSLLGPSGSGKTTLLRLIAGFLRPDKGDIFIGDRRVNDVPPHKRNIGMVFQSYALFPHRTVLENVAFGLEMRGVSREEVLKRSREALEMVRMEKRAAAFPRELSGGQQQRVAVARSISSRPAVWLLDEPLSALDRKLRIEMQVELRSLQRHLAITAIYVTHDQEEALAMSDRIAIFREGRIAQQGTARDLYERPADAFVAEFLGSANLLDAVLHKVDSGWAAEVEGSTFPLAVGPGFSDGSKVRLAVRPERLTLRSSPAAGGLQATVQNLVYLGCDLRVALTTPSGSEIVARLPSTGVDGLAELREGSVVFASWRAEEAVLV